MRVSFRLLKVARSISGANIVVAAAAAADTAVVACHEDEDDVSLTIKRSFRLGRRRRRCQCWNDRFRPLSSFIISLHPAPPGDVIFVAL